MARPSSEPTLTRYALQPWPKGRYRRFRAARSCHRNAWMLACDHPDELSLVKGYALTEGLWVGHWWCVDRDSRVVDPSWRNEGAAYVGVEVIDLDAHTRAILASGSHERGVPAVASDALVPALERANAAPMSATGANFA